MLLQRSRSIETMRLLHKWKVNLTDEFSGRVRMRVFVVLAKLLGENGSEDLEQRIAHRFYEHAGDILPSFRTSSNF